MKTKLVVVGAAGRMGRRIVALAVEAGEFDIVGAVEIESHPREVLKQRIRDGILPEFPIWDDVTTFRSDNEACREYMQGLWEIRDELIISGGFPCQDISSAGKGAGLNEGTRSGLWFEMARIISEIRPRYAFVENSPMLVSRGLDVCLGGFAEMAPRGLGCGSGRIGCALRFRVLG